MAEKKKITCTLAAETHTIAYYSPCEARELDMVIKAKFGIDRNAQLELYDEEGDIVALSCSMPNNSCFRLVAFVPPSRAASDAPIAVPRYADNLSAPRLSRPHKMQIPLPRSYLALEPLTVHAGPPGVRHPPMHSTVNQGPRPMPHIPSRSRPDDTPADPSSVQDDSAQHGPPLAECEDLMSVLRKLNSADSLKRLLQVVSSEAARMTNSQFVETFMVHNDTLTRLLNNPTMESLPSQGIVGHVARTNTILRSRSAKTERYFNDDIDTPVDLGDNSLHAVLCAPIMTTKGCVAVMAFSNRNGGDAPYTALDAWVVDQLTRHSGLLLELLQERQCQNDLAQSYIRCARLLTMMPGRGVYVSEFLKKAMCSLQDSIRADRCSLLLVDHETQELRAHDPATGSEIRVPLGKGIAGQVVTSGQLINAKDLDSDPRFNPTVDRQTGYHTKTLLCAPLKNSHGQIFGVVNALNKRGCDTTISFNDNDEDLMKSYAVLISTALDVSGNIDHCDMKSSAFDMHTLAGMAQEVHSGGTDYLGYIAEILRHLTAQVEVDSCALLLYCPTSKSLCCKHPENESEYRIELEKSSLKPVVIRGVPLRLADKSNTIDSSIDLIAGGTARAVLAYPIHNPVTSSVLGVLCLTRFKYAPIPETSFEILGPSAALVATLLLKIVMPSPQSPFVDGLGLSHISEILHPEGKSKLNVTGSWSAEDSVVKPAYARYTMFDLQPKSDKPNRSPSSTEELHFHALSNILNQAGEFAKTRITVDRYLSMRRPIQDSFRTFSCDVLEYPIDDLLCSVIDVLVQELNFSQEFNVALAQMVNFAGTVCNNYRDVPYHNVYHACDVLQACYAALVQCKAKDFLTPLDQFSLLVSALCHDLDHPGVNNPYLVSSGHRLATLYNDQSVLESYHTAATFLLLENAECNVLATLSPVDYQEARSTIISNILATDMKNHFGYVRKLSDRNVDTKPFKGDDGVCELADRRLIMESIIKCADLVHCVRPFPCAKRWEDLVMEEFFQQGDKERELGLPIGPVNDRFKVDIPKSQIFFYKTFGRPLFANIAQILPGMQCTVDTLDANLRTWEEISAKSSAGSKGSK